ncbi:MAG: NAD(P)H-dependent glycerol-3-phosphate dehydrogenase [Methanobrevibacter woesei]|uniref:NAD(P)H-dependent glycerol-3-phosphate dehydrogenase n=1 Tax=Methanobrevibacter woesei TaxID=190976 RepID=UPI0023F07F50|nr:NAD(P)H-dependent glycerol-3-phosphate dehydrogenase [Methanobrevibacter woesei]MCI7290688.1 NAD(P)H-dependent glycerol-3-phosphate dehydrogenase [Methanobrevibacter woesei]
MLKVGIIGAGALGTAIAQSISKNLEKVYLYARRKEVVDDININSYNSDYYPNIKLNKNIICVGDLSFFHDADCLILTIPSSNLRDIMNELKNIIKKDCILLSSIKGIEKSSSKTASEIIRESCKNPCAVLSGPNIAREIMLNLPVASTLAIDSNENEIIFRKIMESNEFKLQFTNDIVGTELCGVIKNILAISFGICEGLNVNDSAKFAILNKGFYETKKIIEKLGGNPSTIFNYCGFGDIVTASTLSVSRNHTLGVLYGQKIVIDEKATGVIFEGKNSIITIKSLCDNNNIKSIIVDFVYDVIINKFSPEKSFKELWDKLE